MIKPTIGRIVWVRSVGSLDEQPFAGIITYVHSNEMLNLSVFDATGIPHPRTFVPLVQEGDDCPEQGFFAEWMPYQLEQAKKHESADLDVVNLNVPHDFAHLAEPNPLLTRLFTKSYPDGTTAIGPEPLPDASPEQDQDSDQVATATSTEPQPEALPKKTKKATP